MSSSLLALLIILSVVNGSRGDQLVNILNNLAPKTKSYHVPPFFIPAINSSEQMDEKSFIRMAVHVCSEPGGQVIVVENKNNGPKQRQIMRFENNGITYRCNHWPTGEDQDTPDNLKNVRDSSWPMFMSETNDVKIEITLPSGCSPSDCSVIPPIPDNLGMRKFVCKRFLDNGDGGRAEFRIFELLIVYEQVAFQSIFNLEDYVLKPDNKPDAVRTIPVVYTPNQVLTYVFDRRVGCDGAQPCNQYYFGISVDVFQLDLDFDRGDYLLVGPGRMPNFRKGSLSQIISSKVTAGNPRRLWIDSERAFLRLVTHNSLKGPDTAVQFQWRPADTIVIDSSQSDANQRLAEQSISLCFIKTTLLMWNTTQFQEHFKKELLHIANKFLINYGGAQTTLISMDSIYLRQAEEWSFSEGDHTITVVQVNMVITSPYDPNYPLLQRAELDELFFEGGSSRTMFASTVTVNNCQFYRITLWRILAPIIFILAISAAITGAFWAVQRKTTKNSMVLSGESSQALHRQLDRKFNDDDAMMY